MSEQPQSIQPPDEPLDPHTLRVVIERLGERITHAETERENDASEGLPADEMADWDTRIEALELARWDIENIAKTAHPRARVVVLPEPDEISADGTQAAWKRRGWGGYYVMADSELGELSQAGHGTPECARARALAILAAAEFAGGAK